MSAPYIIPFNHQPMNVVSGSGSYTVPSGKYARVCVTLGSAISLGVLTGSATAFSGATIVATSANNQVVIDVYLKAGDVLSFSTTSAASYSVLTSGGASSATFYPNTTASSLVSINSVIFSSAISNLSGIVQVSGSSNSTMGFTPSANNIGYYISQEYNVIS